MHLVCFPNLALAISTCKHFTSSPELRTCVKLMDSLLVLSVREGGAQGLAPRRRQRSKGGPSKQGGKSPRQGRGGAEREDMSDQERACVAICVQESWPHVSERQS